MQSSLTAPAAKRFTLAPLLLPLALWILALAFAPLPDAISPLFSLQEFVGLVAQSPARYFIAVLPLALAAVTLWQRRRQPDALLVGAGALTLLSALASLRLSSEMAIIGALWWSVFWGVLWLSRADREWVLGFCLLAFGVQIVATLGAYFVGYESFITPRFGARAGGMAGSPNQIYPWSLIWAALFYAAARQTDDAKLKHWLWAGVVGSIAVLLLTFSRAGWIGLALVLPLALSGSLAGWKRILPWLAVALLLLGAATVRTHGALLSPDNDGSAYGRTQIWSESWRLFREAPLLGHGVGQIARRTDLKVQFVEPKNIYAQFALEGGLLGLGCFALFAAGLWTRARQLWRASEVDATSRLAARTAALALPALLVAGLFDTPVFGHYERIVPTIAFLLLAGLVAAAPRRATMRRATARVPLPPTPATLWDSPQLQEVPTSKTLHSPAAIADALRCLDVAMRAHDVEYFVIGSCARLAYLGEPSPIADIDIVVLERHARRRAVKAVKQVGLETQVLVDQSMSRFFEVKNGAYFLSYGRLRLPLDARIFEKRWVNWEGASLPTFAPQTLLHFYRCIVGSPLRPKDWDNAFRFARFLRGRREFDHALYRPFHLFAQRWRYFPLQRLQLRWRRQLNALPASWRHSVLSFYGTFPGRALRVAINAIVPLVCVGPRDMSSRTPQRRTSSHRARRDAFTLVEILIVLAIIGVLVGLLFPAFSQARERARRASCAATLANFGKAFHLYSQDYDGLLPNPGGRGMLGTPSTPAVDAADNGAAWYSAGQITNKRITDRGGLLPYMDRVNKNGNNDWACPNAMEANSPAGGDASFAVGQSYTMNDYLRGGHPGQAVLTQQDAPAALNPSYHTGASLSQIGASDGHSASDIILLYEAVQRNSGSVNRNGSPYWGRSWLSRYGQDDLPQGAPEEYHQGFSNFLFCDGHVKALRPTVTWTKATQPALVQFNPSYADARGGRSGKGTVDAWNPRTADVIYP